MVSATTDRRLGLVGNTAVKVPVQAATTANITLSGQQTIDGVAVVASNAAGVADRVLVKNQTDAADNGIYDVSTGTWMRSKDANGSYDLVKGTLVYVTGGTVNGGSYYTITSDNPIIIDTDDIDWDVAVAAGSLAAQLASSSAGLGADMIGLSIAAHNDPGTLGGFLQYPYGRTAAEVSAGVTPTNYAYPPGNVKRYGAVGDGSTDDTTAISNADACACLGNLGLDGVTRKAEGTVYFPPGRYKVTALTFRGAPWAGAGEGVTFIDHYASSGACIDAVGTNTVRRLLNISDMTINGSNATGTAYGLRLGYNQRSFGALRRVRIDNFPGPAIYFDDPTWSMSFHDVYCSFNGADSIGTAIHIDASLAEGTLLAIDWFNLHLENNGFAGSGLGGGMELPTNAVYVWKFYGGVWEGNFGNAEARFNGCIEVHITGLYTESEAASVTNGLVFDDTFGSISNSRIAGELGMAGDGLKFTGTCNFVANQILSNIKWVNDISLADTSIVHMIGEGALNFSVGAGTQFRRISPKRIQLTDAATITTDAAQGSSFYVTLAGNRTMGAPTNPSIGQRILYTFTQDGTGGRTVTWNAVFKVSWSNTGNTLGKKSTIEFEYDGTSWVQVAAQGPYV